MRLLTPLHSRTTWVLPAGMFTSLDSSHGQDNPHAHNSHNYDRIVRERGRLGG